MDKTNKVQSDKQLEYVSQADRAGDAKSRPASASCPAESAKGNSMERNGEKRNFLEKRIIVSD